jgi:ABC-type transporter Mla subunit MlaD
MFGIPWYLTFILVYTIVYIFVYFWQFLSEVISNSLGSDIENLKSNIAEETSREESGYVNHKVSGDGEEIESVGSKAERMAKSTTLDATYSSDLVQQATRQLKANYPHGDFRRFDLERMPAYAAYTERLTAARNMAGLFVLFGLLGTMFKLNEVVGEIGGAASGGSMDPAGFLEKMGAIMGNIGGAFDSSIYGLFAMVVVLVVVGLIDRVMQKRFDRLDLVVQGKLIPGLSELQLKRMPNLTVGDLIEETSTLLNRLNGSVKRMTDGMNESLGNLSEEIEGMMHEFGSFTNQQAELQSALTNLKEYTKNVEDVTGAIEKAGHHLSNPINRFNQQISQALEQHMATVEQALEAQDDDRKAMKRENKSALADLRSLVSDGVVDPVARYIETMEAHSDEQRQAMTDIEAALKKTAEALKAANSQELTRVLERMDEEVNTTAKRLSDVTQKMDGSAQRMDGSARELAKASAHLRAASDQPVTAFDWINRNVQRLRNGNGRKG